MTRCPFHTFIGKADDEILDRDVRKVPRAVDGGEACPTDIAGRRFQEPDPVAPGLQDRIVGRHAMQRTPQLRRTLGECLHPGHVGGDNARPNNAALQQNVSA